MPVESTYEVSTAASLKGAAENLGKACATAEEMEARLLRLSRPAAPIPPSAEELSAAAPLPTAQREHLTAAPLLLPSIIFQDLVFGRDLGSGSFSTVRYCKHVQRGRPAVAWPEYAAKVLKKQVCDVVWGVTPGATTCS